MKRENTREVSATFGVEPHTSFGNVAPSSRFLLSPSGVPSPSTSLSKSDNGEIVFKAWGWKDKNDFLDILKVNANKDVAYLSADANGTAKNVIKKDKGLSEKDFEKLETIAVGRMLALLGYGVGGEIASSEEMEEFEAYQAEKHEQTILNASVVLQNAKTIKDLAKTWNGLPASLKQQLTTIKDECKAKLANSIIPCAMWNTEKSNSNPDLLPEPFAQQNA